MEICIGCGEPEGLPCDCDCGNTIYVCRICLTDDKVLACGECGITEAVVKTEYSLAMARLATRLGGVFHDFRSLLRVRTQELKRLVQQARELKQEQNELEQEEEGLP